MEFCSALWGLPFLGIILSVSLFPLLCHNFWNKYAGRVILFWSSLYLFFVAYLFGFFQFFLAVFEPIVTDYIPFIILISTLYILSGGIFIDFPKGYGPYFNVIFLFCGSIIAGFIGTTGATTLLIRPFLRSNSQRKYKTHLTVFFIFLIANIGGVTTPLGDPPLFIGFLKGIDFFWFIKNLYPFLLNTAFILCALFFAIDFTLFKFETTPTETINGSTFVIRGVKNLFLMALVLLIVVFCNFKSCILLSGHEFSVSSILRNSLLILISLISLKTTPPEIRHANCFSFASVKEVAELFAGIFITVTPIIHILRQGMNGAFKCIFEWIAPNGEFIAKKCFWASGLLSSVLDNAPTFLIFFHLAGGDASILMTNKSHILTAFSISTVFMGALTYIGNAPNLMAKSISDDYGVKVPSFLGYLIWSFSILLPVFTIISWSL
ncbi:MAG: sodium:proton antiporter [Holosporaceae bacterium]|jgi:Na+/H+ antiporter NhaD/arsenite permease-like protein|nr:sodium:proton antiporter [Holosporaceae bacterium]